MLGWKEERGSRCYIRNISARESNLLTVVLEGPLHQLLKVSRPSLKVLLTALPALHFSSFWDEASCIEAGIAWQTQGFQQGSACYSSCSQTFILQAKRGKLQMTLLCRQKIAVSNMSSFVKLQKGHTATYQRCPRRLLHMSNYQHHSTESCFIQNDLLETWSQLYGENCGYSYYI